MIGADFLLNTLKSDEIQNVQSIHIENAIVAGWFDGYNLTLPYDIRLNNMVFTGFVNFNSSQLESLTAYNIDFQDHVDFARSKFNGDLDLRDNTFNQGLYFYGAHVSGEMLLDGSRILATTPLSGASYPSEFWFTTVDGLASFMGTNFKGDTYFYGSSFSRLSMWDAVLEGNASFEASIVEKSAEFGHTQFLGEANFEQAEYGDAGFWDARFAKKVSFLDANIIGDLDFTGAIFDSADITNLSYITVGDSTFLEDITSAAGFDLGYSVFGNVIVSPREGTVIPVLNLTQSEVSKLLRLQSGQVNNLYANGLKNEGTVVLENISITETLDLQNAQLYLLIINKLQGPKSPTGFNLRGMIFTDIDLGDKGLTEETWQGLLLLANQSTYSPQSYASLATFLTDKGHPDWAAEVELALKRRERDEILKPFSAAWLWSWFLEVFTGYGYRPALAFIWSAVVIAIGAFIFRKEEYLIALDTSEASPPYNPVLYSFDLFIPYIELGIATMWNPKRERKFAWIYKHIHQLLGWILLPIALLSFGGIIG